MSTNSHDVAVEKQKTIRTGIVGLTLAWITLSVYASFVNS